MLTMFGDQPGSPVLRAAQLRAEKWVKADCEESVGTTRS